jgi:hypothetical protein
LGKGVVKLKNLKAEKPWAKLRMTRKQYEQLRPWKNTGMSRERWEEVASFLPDEMIDLMYRDIDAERLVSAVFGSNGDGS